MEMEQIRASIEEIKKIRQCFSRVCTGDYDCKSCPYKTERETSELRDIIVNAVVDGQIIILPVPIGESVFVPYVDDDLNGEMGDGVEEFHLAGYIKEGDNEFYTTYDESGTTDIPVDKLCVTHEEAQKMLGILKQVQTIRTCRVCGCTWDHACPGGCYWVEQDLCSRCAGKEEE